jgi:hypothetical protein
MTSEELATAGVPPTEENAPPSTGDLATKSIRDSGSHEDGEIRSKNKSVSHPEISNFRM